MSYEIVKSITIKNDKVFVTAASSNVYPRHFENWEVSSFSKIYQEAGLPQLLHHISSLVWSGELHLQRGSKLCKALLEGFEPLAGSPTLRCFLDSEHAAKFISSMALYAMRLGPKPDIEKLYALRHDKEAVMEICAERPEAFDHASFEIQKDRDAAKEHILANGDKLLFNMPRYFKNDKELAILALQKDGTTFRGLSPDLQDDKEIALLAFNSSLDRPHFEHLPDLLSEDLQNDLPFMRQLVTVCPRMHVFRCPQLLYDKGFVKAWLEAGGWSPYSLRNLPDVMLADRHLQSIILSKANQDPEDLKKVHMFFNERGFTIKPSLDSLLRAADKRSAAAPASELNRDPDRQM